ncbi:MAG: glycosyl hydrolase family protein [Lachnospiraceae bacterium]|nr:glycosyl hydrolase family protein [Lachnospiraceae bacterium]
MKRKNVFALSMAIVMLVGTLLTACGSTKVIELADKTLAQGTTVIDFSKEVDSSVIFESDGWTNGDVFNVVWTKNNVKYEDGTLKLGITKEDKTAWLDEKEVTYHYTAGEARTQNYYGYGDYEVKMKPSANHGTASTFFVCTGPYDEKITYNEDGTVTTSKNPHDEIDIEFLGKDTTHVQFNFFVDGKGGNEYMYDLGFDASKEYHEYGFRWEEDSITWFVDDKPVYKVTTDKNVETGANVKVVDKLPSTPGRMLANYWCGNLKAEGWMGKYSGNTKDNGCEYQWISTTAEGAPLNGPAPDQGGEEKVEIDWSKVTAIAPTFGSTDLYTVAIDNNSANVKYDAIGGSSYLNVEMDIADAAASKNVLHLTLTNNGTTDAQVRVNIVDDALLSSGAQNASTNQSATLDGAEVYTDLVWGGSFFTIPAGKSAEAVVYFTGSVEKLQLMIDSSRNDANTYAGDVTVSEIKFAQDGEVETPADPNPEKPVDPNPGTGEGEALTFWANAGYTVDTTAPAKVLNVKYEGADNTYAPIGSYVADLANANNTFSFKVTNNGSEMVAIRVDVQGTTKVGNSDCLNVSATADGNAAYTDMEWGGSKIEVAAGATVTVVVSYDTTTDKGTATNVMFFTGSQLGTGATVSVDVTLSDFQFSTK